MKLVSGLSTGESFTSQGISAALKYDRIGSELLNDSLHDRFKELAVLVVVDAISKRHIQRVELASATADFS
jgi:hypothetical protein